MSAADLKGRRFGRLVAVTRVGTNAYGYAVWHCECDCGGFTKASSRLLAKGRTRSCGCLYRDTRNSRSSRHDPRYAGWERIP